MKRMILMAAMLFCVFVAGAQDKDGKGVPYRYEVRLGWSGYPTADDDGRGLWLFKNESPAVP